jgi:hypothetical protein
VLRTSITNARVGLAALALLAPLQLLAIARAGDDEAERRQDAAPVAARPVPIPGAAAPLDAAPVWTVPTSTPPAAPAPVQLVTESDVVPVAAAATPAPAPAGTFAERFPAQAAATQDPDDPASTRWALLIGINEHRGTVADNIGSRQDAEDLRTVLLAHGWRDDHILVLTDRQATRDDIVAGLAWLADKTDEDSVAVFHYSGHSKKWRHDVDGDGERDVGLWPSDDGYIVDSELVDLLEPVQPQALWVSFATCNAAGMADPGLAQPGRVLTFSSGAPQKSYEHPAWGNSVWGWHLIEQALGAGLGDLDGDGRVTVQEAFAWARPRASDTTSGQRYGPQDGVMIDLLGGELDLLVPDAPPPSRTPATPAEPDGSTSTPPPPPPEQGQQPPPPEPSEENHGNRICLLCG